MAMQVEHARVRRCLQKFAPQARQRFPVPGLGGGRILGHAVITALVLIVHDLFGEAVERHVLLSEHLQAFSVTLKIHVLDLGPLRTRKPNYRETRANSCQEFATPASLSTASEIMSE